MRQRCGRCIHRKMAGVCEKFSTRLIDAHDGWDCSCFEEGDGLISPDEFEQYRELIDTP